MMTQDLSRTLCQVMPLLSESADELAALDAAAGDGDLGVTVREGCRMVQESIGMLPSDTSLAELLKTAGAAFARGNPSSFAALVGGGLLAAARAVEDRVVVDRATAAVIGRAVADSIAERGGAAPGDRTILDALLPSLEPLDQASEGLEDLLDAVVDAAAKGVQATKTMAPRKGRAAWTGDRAVGHPDAGAVAFLRFVERLRDALVTKSPPSFPPDSSPR